MKFGDIAALVAIALMMVQAIVVCLIMKRHKKFFKGRPASQFGVVLGELGKHHPSASFLFKAMYILTVLEAAVIGVITLLEKKG